MTPKTSFPDGSMESSNSEGIHVPSDRGGNTEGVSEKLVEELSAYYSDPKNVLDLEAEASHLMNQVRGTETSSTELLQRLDIPFLLKASLLAKITQLKKRQE
ncbi:MAG: hypothetical protein UT34_C0001G0052 [candidate division WS6 bacterium GW2011_GWF2_39_15]|uniref:Uncharacterized protein n=1 Tax=candidate division WS6 bacterium GW2011_GWF2_39_15 TaxID=1619100 RepID=A0A0G0QWJ5_9BACT|nr:MAG: hypothetical protein UT34_C0001G0052 [candidate division WS6 bacterium GW2011_GWF2_39_15]